MSCRCELCHLFPSDQAQTPVILPLQVQTPGVVRLQVGYTSATHAESHLTARWSPGHVGWTRITGSAVMKSVICAAAALLPSGATGQDHIFASHLLYQSSFVSLICVLYYKHLRGAWARCRSRDRLTHALISSCWVQDHSSSDSSLCYTPVRVRAAVESAFYLIAQMNSSRSFHLIIYFHV